MKKIILLTSLVLLPLSCNASIVLEDTTSPAVMKNQGYSTDMTNITNVLKHRAVGQEYYTDDEKEFRNSNKVVRFFRKLYAYTDPAAEDYSLFHHEIEVTPKYTDF